MSQFSLYQNNDKGTATAYPYFVDVQSEMLDTLNTRLVIPLTPVEMLEKKAPVHLCPVIHIDEGDFVILTHQMASVPNKILRDPVNELSTFRNEVIAAIDFLITGI
ncbi:CcdB family protein [Vibrio breoganii]|uniref:Toxin CcdB n=1 Tax=Vibrio breoganii TaxID=553239 RepID=A0AAJ5JNR4_9VIBR|nr:CcdB family protein [Vibrio breoganii]ANO34956.1 plasmid maintenance protein CcdB [Vibrio breoganii]OEF87304.1 plasmid maintenance protein CcdB [Vibrio breoganii 1C10]PMG76598.1 plasmid maintenance protein CcdB [Vibrio breoganii]PMG94251.1 plasmid maintenance protein CcdB [Vibrio breoganii]PMH15374.1 plasmid maintenance protein CcdB [Vibrio breoganii]